MVVPLVGEQAWLSALKSIPSWHPPRAPLIVIAPHPDDETLGAGGLIASHRALGLPVTVVAVTDGEHAYADNAGLAKLRVTEQTAALARLGVREEHIVRLALTDSGVAAQEAELAERLAPLVAVGDTLCAPWQGDFHPDHEACARAAQAVARASGATLISYFFWTWHRGLPATIEGLDLRRFDLNTNQCAAKLEALACHRSQLEHAGEPEILPDNLLWPARLGFEVFAL
jgi:LmbE family N-acetylglucosaminyl deacetylase